MSNQKREPYGVMNILFFLFVGFGIVCAAGNASMKEVSEQSFSSAKDAVTLAIGLIGIMSFWLGMMKILESAGVVSGLARLISPLLGKLFSDVPRGHPALGAIVLNVSANIFGLGNAATPFGIKAMEQLQKLSLQKDTATHAMCLFLAINTSGLAILPLGVIGVRAAENANDPAGIWIPTLIATSISTLVGVCSCLIFRKFSTNKDLDNENSDMSNLDAFKRDSADVQNADTSSLFNVPSTFIHRLSSILLFASFLILLVSRIVKEENPFQFIKGEFASFWFMPFLMLVIVCFGVFRGVRIYDAAVEGAKEGFNVAGRISPFLVVVLVAIGVFRVSGALDFVASIISPFSMLIGMPAEVLPMAIVRPLSGSGAFAIMSEIIQRDPNSYEAFVASVLMGSTETTFYVVTVYFGAVGILKFRYAIACGLLADFAGITAACLSSWWWY